MHFKGGRKIPAAADLIHLSDAEVRAALSAVPDDKLLGVIVELVIASRPKLKRGARNG